MIWIYVLLRRAHIFLIYWNFMELSIKASSIFEIQMLGRYCWGSPNVIFGVIFLRSLYLDFTNWKHIFHFFTHLGRRNIYNRLHFWVITRLHLRILNDFLDRVNFFYHASGSLNVYLGNYELKDCRTVYLRSTKFDPWSGPLRRLIAILVLKISREILVGKLYAQKSFVWVQNIVNFNAYVSLLINKNLEKLLWKEGAHLLLVACHWHI